MVRYHNTANTRASPVEEARATAVDAVSRASASEEEGLTTSLPSRLWDHYQIRRMILDGNSRLAACTALEIEPKIKPWDGEGGTPVSFVISQNIRRRHLSPSKRAWLISQLTTFKRGDVAVQRDQKAEENDDAVSTTSLTLSEAAAVAGVEALRGPGGR
jgi:hypothetical protein